MCRLAWKKNEGVIVLIFPKRYTADAILLNWFHIQRKFALSYFKQCLTVPCSDVVS